MPLYEHTFISRPDISPAEVETQVNDLTEFLGQHGGKVTKVEYWGLRALAYPINKQRKGHYSMLNLDAPAGAIAELEQRHRISTEIMRYLTIKVDKLDEDPSPMMSRKERRNRED